ncbi:MAG: ABC transporter permease [Chloroflexi bacterium]|nr:MAG: ABC transporter permease [Chloroflexota bacterium]
MTSLALRYVLLAAAVLVLNFLLPRLLPGDPLAATAEGGLSGALPALTSQQQAQLRVTYHLDQPLASQFASYVVDLARGDLGWSISRAAPVSRLIGERIPWTLSLVLTAVVIAATSGAALGLVAAWRGGHCDQALVGVCTAVAALPEFLVAMLLLLALSIGLHWFPLQGGETLFAPPGQAWLATLGDRIVHLALPAASLVVANLAAFVLLSRGAIRGVLAEPYLATARAKGLGEWRVALRHATPNALLPVLTLFGMRLGQVLGGAIVVERVFAIPGLGLFAFQAIQARDYPVLQAIFLVSSLTVLLANFLVELAHRRLEPRRYAA